MKIKCLILGCRWKDKGVLWAGEMLIRQECTRCHSKRTVAA